MKRESLLRLCDTTDAISNAKDDLTPCGVTLELEQLKLCLGTLRFQTYWLGRSAESYPCPKSKNYHPLANNMFALRIPQCW